jgi:hypothetical protein
MDPMDSTPMDTTSETLGAFPAFAQSVRARLEAGCAYEATRPAVERPAVDLITEIQEELADVCGWSVALWARLERLRGLAAKVDQDAEHSARPTRGGF